MKTEDLKIDITNSFDIDLLNRFIQFLSDNFESLPENIKVEARFLIDNMIKVAD